MIFHVINSLFSIDFTDHVNRPQCAMLEYNFAVCVVVVGVDLAQGCQVRDFIPRSREYSGLLGFFSGIFFGEKISGKFSGFLENR